MTRLWPMGQTIAVCHGQDTLAGHATPAGFVWQGMSYHIAGVCNRWRIHTHWWESGEAVWREYLKVVTGEGVLCLLYQDLITGEWFLARIYD